MATQKCDDDEKYPGVEWEPDFLHGLWPDPCGYHRYYFKTPEMLEHELEASQTEGTRAEVVQQVRKRAVRAL